MRPEEIIEKKFVASCASLGINAYKFKIDGTKGAPDRVVFLPKGKVVLIEFKQPGGETSKHQDQFIKQLKNLGHECHVCDNWEFPLSLIQTYINE